MRRRVRAGSGATRPSELLARSERPRAGYPGSQRATNCRVFAGSLCPPWRCARRVATLAEVQPGDHVLEIGPGLGSLTLALLERGARVRALELDASLARILQSVLDAAVGRDSD